MLKHVLFISQNIQLEQALFDWVCDFAQAQHAHLTVLRVLPELNANLQFLFNQRLPVDIKQEQQRAVYEDFLPWKKQAHQANVEICIEVQFGKLFYNAIQYVISEQVDCLIKQTESPLSEGGGLFNTQDKHLLRKCPCPVLLHKQGAPLPFNRVMASIDVDLDSDAVHPCPLNQTILNTARYFVLSQSSQLNTPYLEVIHAWQAEAENWVHYWNTELSQQQLLKWREAVRQQHLKAVEQEIAATHITDITVDIVLPKGIASEVIPKVVRKHQIDLLVMGTLGRDGLPGMLIGNTSESILEQINCSVLALKPDDFISPIIAKS